MSVTHATTTGPITGQQWNEEHTVTGLAAEDHTHPATPHADLAAHNTLGLATQAELDGHNHDAAYAGSGHDHDADYEAAGAVATHAGAADPHTGYLKENDANWVDLTDGGATTLHSHAANHPDLATHLALGLEEAGNYATSTHNHDAAYATAGHTHAGGTPLTGRVTADRTNNTTTLANITDLSAFTLTANKVYRFRAVLFVTTNAATVGIHFGVNFTGTTTYVRVGHTMNPVTAPTAAGSAVSHGAATAVNTKILATTAGPGTAPTIVVLEGLIEVGASGGTFSFMHASETASVTTVQRGSYAVVEEIA